MPKAFWYPIKAFKLYVSNKTNTYSFLKSGKFLNAMLFNISLLGTPSKHAGTPSSGFASKQQSFSSHWILVIPGGEPQFCLSWGGMPWHLWSVKKKRRSKEQYTLLTDYYVTKLYVIPGLWLNQGLHETTKHH